jgi:ribonucleoside-diphosphate reductase subunit M2
MDIIEPLLDPLNNRLTVYPIKYEAIWRSYKTQMAAFWTAEEIDFSNDYSDFMKLSKNEQHFIKMILAFFAGSDTIVNINISERFTNIIQVKEAIVAYDYQVMIENIHSEVYSLMIDNIVHDVDEKHKLLNALKEYPVIAKKINWSQKWTQSDTVLFSQRFIATTITEGLFFSGSFCAIFWLKKKNLMPGLCDSNELIARDEGMHTDFSILMYKYVVNQLDQTIVHDMFKEAVEIETEFICESLPCSLLGMNNKYMIDYIKFVADRLLVQLGYEKIWKCHNPFDFMESMSMEGKTNFFESRPTQYQKSSVLNTGRDSSFVAIEDF